MSELSVILDSTVVLQIIQHCQDSNEFTCGKLIGYESEGKLVVVNSFAIPSDLADSEEFTMQRLKYFQDLKFEHFVLGWYLKLGEGENLDLTSVEHQYNLQCEFPKSVMLVYHPGKANADELPFSAYSLTESFFNFFSDDDYSSRKNIEIGLAAKGVFQKFQVKLEVSELVEGFLAQYSEEFITMDDCRTKIPSNSQISANIAYIRDLSVQYYKDNSINYDDTLSDVKTPLNSQYPKLTKRRPSAIERSAYKKPLNVLN